LTRASASFCLSLIPITREYCLDRESTVTIGGDTFLTNFIRTGKMEGASAAPIKYDTFWLKTSITTAEEVEITRKYIDFCSIKFRDDLSICYQEVADPKIFETEGISAWLEWSYPTINDCPLGMLKMKRAVGIDPELLVTKFRAPVALAWVQQQRERLFSQSAKERNTAAAETNRGVAFKRQSDSDGNGNGNGGRRPRNSFRQNGYYDGPPRLWAGQNNPYWLQHPLMQPSAAQQAMAHQAYALPAQVQQPAPQPNGVQQFQGQHGAQQQPVAQQQQQQAYAQGNQGYYGGYYSHQ
jgi:uncharacterized membrane protein YgcG